MSVSVLLPCSESTLRIVLLHMDKQSFLLIENKGNSTVSVKKNNEFIKFMLNLTLNNKNNFCKNQVPDLGGVLLGCKRMDVISQVDL